jgi:hypothetical protein
MIVNNWQQWTVALVLLVCLIRIIQRSYAFFHRTKSSGTPCEGCQTNCALKQHPKKKCCG